MRQIFLFLLLFINCNLFGQKSEVQDIVVKFLDSVQIRAYNSYKINWKIERPELIERTKNIDSLKNLNPIFNDFLKKLEDNHSGVLYMANNEIGMFEKLAVLTNKQAGYPEPKFNAKIINGKYAYIVIPPVMLEQRKYVDSLQHHISELDKKNPEGWILDLSSNTGGGYKPMITPLNGFVNAKKTFSFVNKEGKIISDQKINKNRTYIENHKMFNLMKMDTLVSNKIVNFRKPIIIWVSGHTASSAEFTVAHLYGQKNVKVVGTRTAGMTTGNTEIELSPNFMLALTTGLLKDRNNRIYQPGEFIGPDVKIEPKNKKKPSYDEYLEKTLELFNKK